jgi:hypothetical protein
MKESSWKVVAPDCFGWWVSESDQIDSLKYPGPSGFASGDGFVKSQKNEQLNTVYSGGYEIGCAIFAILSKDDNGLISYPI